MTTTTTNESTPQTLSMISILNRWTGRVLFQAEAISLGEAVKKALEARADLSRANLSRADLSRADLSRADLSRADLSRANLSHANLSDANLSDANLSHANLSDANLSDANLSDANLSDANLSDADLSRANLSDANLSRANLSDANLSDANLSRANLSDANLSRANLSDARDDFFAVLAAAPAEVTALAAALREGRVNGTVYNGDCACLVGTIAHARGCAYTDVVGLRPDADRPAERWFLAIQPGDTPDRSQVTAITLRWIEEWQAQQLAQDALPSATATATAEQENPSS